MVAFNRLDGAFGQVNLEFWQEIMLSLDRYENFVLLLRFCDESDKKILVYEYASKSFYKRCLELHPNSSDLT